MKKHLLYTLTVLFVLPFLSTNNHAQAQDTPFIGDIKLVGFTFCPRGWVEANGTVLEISNHTALFSLYGTTYGGDGRTTFALPDLRGRVPVHLGEGPGLANYVLGEKGGAENVTITPDQLPVHNHTFTELTDRNGTTSGLVIRNGGGEQATPTTDAGGGQAHENRPPFLVMRYCVALEGVFPSRN